MIRRPLHRRLFALSPHGLCALVAVAVAGCHHPIGAAAPANPSRPPATFTIRDVRVFDGERVLERRSVVVVEGRNRARRRRRGRAERLRP